MNKILVPYDFSDEAKQALEFAMQLAKKKGACEVTLFHVIEGPSASAFQRIMGGGDYDPAEVFATKTLIDRVKSLLQGLQDEHSTDKVSVSQKIRMGNADIEIMEQLDKDDMDLVVMGTTGSEGLNEFFVGSNSEKVVRHASCPVITMQKGANAETIKEIVFASDFENLNEDFVKRLVGLQKMLDARLRIVIINTPAAFTSSRLDNKLMDKFIAKHQLSNYTTEIYNYSNEEDGIVAYAEDTGAHMIALGTNQLTGAKHFLKGSIAEDVVNHSNVPVWTYHLRD